MPDRIKDHLGNEYGSYRSMAKTYGLQPSTLQNRLNAGWDLEHALTTKASYGSILVKDHLGNEYPSIKAMAKAYGVSSTALSDNLLKKHLPVKQAIFGKNHVTDHTGKIFRSERAMCRHYGVEQMTYRRRLASGMSQENALLAGAGPSPTGFKCKDHLGHEYPTRQAMCAAYGINTATYLSRIESGWDIGRALTEPNGAMRRCVDWSGRAYESMKAMTATLRLKKSDIPKDADTAAAAAKACMKRWPGTDAGRYRIRECVTFPWFLCEDLDSESDAPHAGEIILHADQILEIFRSEPENSVPDAA